MAEGVICSMLRNNVHNNPILDNEVVVQVTKVYEENMIHPTYGYEITEDCFVQWPLRDTEYI